MEGVRPFQFDLIINKDMHFLEIEQPATWFKKKCLGRLLNKKCYNSILQSGLNLFAIFAKIDFKY